MRQVNLILVAASGEARSQRVALLQGNFQTAGCYVWIVLPLPKRVCADFFPAHSVATLMILRAPRMRFLRHGGIYRSEVGFTQA